MEKAWKSHLWKHGTQENNNNKTNNLVIITISNMI